MRPLLPPVIPPDRSEPHSAIILSAGASSRMGSPKGLLRLEGCSLGTSANPPTVLERMLGGLGAASFSPLFVVIGAMAPLFRSTVKETGFTYVENPRWQHGRASSIKAGLARLGEGCPGVLVWPVDHPFVSGDTLHRLHEMGKRRAGNWIVPTFEGQRGHPPLISREVSRTILAQEDDWPLHTYPRGHPSEVVEVPGDDPFVIGNLDTPEAFNAALRQYRTREARGTETGTHARRG